MVWLGETTRVEWDLWLSWKDTSKQKKKEINVEKMQTPLEKKGCIKNTWLRRFVIWWINTDLLPPKRKNIREWGFDLLPSTKKKQAFEKIHIHERTEAKLLLNMVG